MLSKKELNKLSIKYFDPGRKTGNDKMVSPEQFVERATQFFSDCEREGRQPTSTGLALAVGFSNRSSLLKYKKDKDYTYIIERAMTWIEHGYEQQLADGRDGSGIIFALKNFNWSDKQELDHTSSDSSMRPSVVQLVSPSDDGED